VVVGPHGGPCLATEATAGERTEVVLAALHRLMRQRGEQPAVVQTDRGACFVGAEGGERRALPGRLTLWLWGLGIAHRPLPPGKPWRNGAVERFQGAVEQSWAGEPDGLPDLQAVWNHGKTGAVTPLPYQDRAGFAMERVWEGLARVRVERSVDPQGKLSVWDRPLRVGRRWAQRMVVVTFDATRRLAVVRDKQETVLIERPLPWLTSDWLWAGIDAADPAFQPDGTSTFS
jgi:transposase InsO family protein